MKIRSVTLWMPKLYRKTKDEQNNQVTYMVGGPYTKEKGALKIKAIELSPTSEVVVVLENGEAKVFGYIPFRVDLDPT